MSDRTDERPSREDRLRPDAPYIASEINTGRAWMRSAFAEMRALMDAASLAMDDPCTLPDVTRFSRCMERIVEGHARLAKAIGARDYLEANQD